MLLPALIHGVLKDNISLWMTVYIMDSFGVDLQQSSGYVLLILPWASLPEFWHRSFTGW